MYPCWCPRTWSATNSASSRPRARSKRIPATKKCRRRSRACKPKRFYDGSGCIPATRKCRWRSKLGMQTKAVLRYARISPQKCRLVVDTIRGKSATLAVNTLKFMPKKGARIVLKVLDSAIANAYNNFNADVDDLKVTRIEVDPAPMLKRFHARAKGRGVRIAKRSSHILVQVSDGKREA